MVAEVIKSDLLPGYLARVRLAKPPEPMSIGNVTISTGASENFQTGLASLQEAQQACDFLCRHLQEDRLLSWGMTVGYEHLTGETDDA